MWAFRQTPSLISFPLKIDTFLNFLTTLWFTGLFIEAMINESVTSICNNRQGFWRHEDIIRQKSIEVHRATATRHTPSIVWKKPIWEMARDLNACSAVAPAERRRRRWRQIRRRAEAEEGKAACTPSKGHLHFLLRNPFSQLSLLKIERVSQWTWRLRG